MQDIIKMLMALGALKTATQSLADDEVELLAAELKREMTIKHADEEEDEPEAFEDDPADLVPRPPVVTIMGHVDHGKTTLLDAIRNAKVVETEAGGITQHIGAYQVPVDGRKVTFLDTPGHEAFTAMRARGAKVTDIAVLVVAADDGVMPQTKESISHARAAEVPIVVAVNKVDLPDANPDRVLGELATEGLQPEEWGGDIQVARVSAKQQTGLDELLEKVLLVADAELELNANPNAEASGPIIESRLDVGRGPVATMLVQRGTLKVGDAVVAGDAWGKVRALHNEKGDKLKDAEAGRPGRDPRLRQAAAGRRALPASSRTTARPATSRRSAPSACAASSSPPGPTSGDHARGPVRAPAGRRGPGPEHRRQGRRAGLGRGDRQRAREDPARRGAGERHPLRASAGSPRTTSTSPPRPSGMVVGFNVRPNAETRALAEREGVEIRTYDVIYKLTEEIEQALVGMLTAVTTEETIGEAEVRNTFRASRVGTIAGCMVTNGVIRRGANVRVIRDGTVVYTTTIDSLKRFQDDVREVLEGFECGIHLANYDDVKVGDVLEVFETREVERTSLDEPSARSTESPAGSPGSDSAARVVTLRASV